MRVPSRGMTLCLGHFEGFVTFCTEDSGARPTREATVRVRVRVPPPSSRR